MKLAVFGISGAGKTYVGRLIANEYSLRFVSTGEICRTLSMILFNSDSKSNLNKISEKLREIDPHIWLKAALRQAPADALILDSIRYPSDYEFLRERGFKFVHVTTDPAIADHRLKLRGQEITGNDKTHPSETSLMAYEYDMVVLNGESQTERSILDQIRALSNLK